MGFAVGSFSAIIPEYIIEVSDDKSKDGIAHEFGISFGIFCCTFLGNFFSWRTQPYIWLFFSMALIFLYSYLPDISKSIDEVERSSIFTNKPLFFSCLLLMFFQQFSGINAIQSNLSAILQNNFESAFAASSKCFAPIVSFFLVEKYGLKNLFKLSSICCSISLLAVVICPDFLKVLSILIYLFSFGIGLGPIPWIIPPLVFSPNVRSNASSTLASSNWILSYFVVSCYSPLASVVNQNMIIAGFGIINLFSFIFGCFYFPVSSLMEQRRPIEDEFPLLFD